MAEEQEKMIICPLCGHNFKKGESEKGCEGCPLYKNNCGLVRCPNCGYEFPEVDDLSIMDRIRNFFKINTDKGDKGGQ